MRMPRLSMPNVAQHVIVRSNSGEHLFKCAHDCSTYLQYLELACEKYGSELHAYVLMPNHVHLLISSTESGAVAKTLQALARHYVPYFNNRYDRRGALFAPRYRSALVEGGIHTLQVYRYIEQNPLRAELQCELSNYRWSSYGANALGIDDEIVKPEASYLSLGDNGEMRRKSYSRFMSALPCDAEIKQIRSQTNRSLAIGSGRFLQQIEDHFDISLKPRKRGGDRRSMSYRSSRLNLAEAV